MPRSSARNTRGVRIALGVNWAHGVGHLVSAAAADPRRTAARPLLWLFVLPEQLDVTLERDTGSLREARRSAGASEARLAEHARRAATPGVRKALLSR